MTLFYISYFYRESLLWRIIILFFLCIGVCPLEAKIELGIDVLFSSDYPSLLKGKKVGLITNHTAINAEGVCTLDVLKERAEKEGFVLQALFAPEHGLKGVQYAEELVEDQKDEAGIPIYSLHGSTRRLTPAMLKGITLLIYDIQDLGSRSYTYSSTLFYAMEEAAKAGIPLIVLDRPNPLGGLLVDGPTLHEKWRSFVGYLNVPYCHGLTIGELARYFNGEYQVGTHLTVIPMKGWQRNMLFEDTGLAWIPTSPHVPEARTAFYYPTTGILGELQIVNIGVGYTLPFKVVGAPWIEAETFAQHLNAQQFPGVRFHPFHYRPFFGRFANQTCHGVLILITDLHRFLPVSTQYLLLGALKNLYPLPFHQALESSAHRHQMFHKVNGTEEVYQILKNERYVIWKLRALHEKEREAYLIKRKPYLITTYE